MLTNGPLVRELEHAGRRPPRRRPRRRRVVVHGRADADPPGAHPTGATGADAELHVRRNGPRRGLGGRHPAVRRVRRTTTSCSTSTTPPTASTARRPSSPPTCSARRAIPSASRRSPARTACPSSSTPPTPSARSADGRPVGGFGVAEVFSLSPTKVVVGGEGGLVTTNDEALAERDPDRPRLRQPGELRHRRSPGSTPGCRSCTRRWRWSRWRSSTSTSPAGRTSSPGTGRCLAAVPGICPQHVGARRRVDAQGLHGRRRRGARSASTATRWRSRCGPRASTPAATSRRRSTATRRTADCSRPSYLPRTDWLASRVISLPLWRDLDDDAVEAVADVDRPRPPGRRRGRRSCGGRHECPRHRRRRLHRVPPRRRARRRGHARRGARRPLDRRAATTWRADGRPRRRRRHRSRRGRRR